MANAIDVADLPVEALERALVGKRAFNVAAVRSQHEHAVPFIMNNESAFFTDLTRALFPKVSGLNRNRKALFELLAPLHAPLDKERRDLEKLQAAEKGPRRISFVHTIQLNSDPGVFHFSIGGKVLPIMLVPLCINTLPCNDRAVHTKIMSVLEEIRDMEVGTELWSQDYNVDQTVWANEIDQPIIRVTALRGTCTLATPDQTSPVLLTPPLDPFPKYGVVHRFAYRLYFDLEVSVENMTDKTAATFAKFPPADDADRLLEAVKLF